MSGEGLSHYVKVLQDKGYIYGRHFLPHDAGNHSVDTGKTRLATLASLGLRNLTILKRSKINDGINEVRNILPICFFDKEKTTRGLDALREYHKAFDSKNKVWRDKPEHDWSSNASDAFRYLALSIREEQKEEEDFIEQSDMLFNGGWY